MADQLTGNDRALNLLRAFIDLRDLGVAIEPLYLEAANGSKDSGSVDTLKRLPTTRSI